MVWTFPRGSAWSDVAGIWQGVQALWGWPAPAIAVDGVGAYQLWFALAHPVPSEQARACAAQALQRWCPQLPLEGMGVYPGDAPPALPGREAAPDQWSAFVAPDLAALFMDSPWLDGPPSPEAQADLLLRFEPTPAAAWEAAAVPMPPAVPGAVGEAVPAMAQNTYTDPRGFLIDVMNNPAVDWRSRIEAAKILLAQDSTASTK